MKPLLTSDGLIAHMESKGIQFTIDSKDCAKHFLEEHNYYLKLASYRENYQKYIEGPKKGKYINLEFAYLRELSTIDMYLRYLIIQMSLDIEHYLKVKLIHAVENTPGEDGYHLIRKFNVKDNNNVLARINRHRSSEYCKALIDKYQSDYPVWVFVELISFGDLTNLCSFYSNLYKNKIMDSVLLNSVRDIRNASAHSNCLINHLRPGNNRAHGSIITRVKKIPGISENTRDKKLSNKILYDFTCLLFAYDEIVSSEETKRKRKREISDFFSVRMVKNKEWFLKNNIITSSYQFSKKIVDNFSIL